MALFATLAHCSRWYRVSTARATQRVNVKGGGEGSGKVDVRESGKGGR